MGTRNLTMVVLDGEYRVAQYGQFDGYPSGQGATVLEFLEKWNRELFLEKLKATRFATSEELGVMQTEFEKQGESWWEEHSHISREMAAKILPFVQREEPGLVLKNELDFAADSVMCEYAYLIDLDHDRLEVYRGFNEKDLTAEDRFHALPLPERAHNYRQIKLAASYALNALPTVEQMEDDCAAFDKTRRG